MTQSNLIELAKQGDPQAIANLMNRTLQPKGISATVDRMGDRLQIYLAGEHPPNRESLMTFIQNGINNLGLETIDTIEVIGQQTGQAAPLWSQEWQLDPAEAETGFEFPARAAAAAPAAPPPPPPSSPKPPPAPPLRPPGIASDPDATVEDALSDLNEAIDAAVREGFSDLEYRPLNDAPDLTPADQPDDPDNLPPELLAADAAQRLRDELPDALLDDRPADPLDTEMTGAAGSAPFPSINDLAVDGTLQQMEDLSPTVPPDAIAPESDPDRQPDPDLNLNLDELDTLAPPITPSLDMDTEDDELQLTGLSDDLEDDVEDDLDNDDLDDEPLDPQSVDLEDDVETAPTEIPLTDSEEPDWVPVPPDMPDPTNEPLLPPADDADPERLEPADDPPSGQMVGSPTAIQPVSQEERAANDEGDRNRFGVIGGMIIFFLVGWILALIGFSFWSREPAPTPEPSPSPQAESPKVT